MTVETTSTFFDSSTQTGKFKNILMKMLRVRLLDPSAMYDNHHYHEECSKCNSCGINLTGPNQKRARRFKVSTFVNF